MRRFITTPIILVSFFLAAVLFLPGCTDNFQALNTPDDKLVASEVGATSLGQAFGRAQWQGAQAKRNTMHSWQNLFQDSYAQYFSNSLSSDQYVEAGFLNGWNYAGAGWNLNFVREFTRENDMAPENAVANIWRVQQYQLLTDVWGPIPYSEVGNGEKTVPYDSQESIYKDFLNRLENAVETLENNRSARPFGDGDLLYRGNVNKWIKYANSLQLRVAMRMSDVEPGLAKQEAEEAVNRGVIESNEDNATLHTTPNNVNHYQTITGWGYFRMSTSMESVLEGYDDPRLSEYFNPAKNGDRDGDGSPYEGISIGAGPDSPGFEPHFSDMDTRWLSESLGGGSNPPWPVMFASEVYFLRAEGALRGWNMGGTAEELYNKGIQMSLSQERVGASPEEIEKYINSGKTPVSPKDRWNLGPMSDIPVKFQSGADKETKLEQIITQKWIALYPMSPQAWAEMRRTGYPRGFSITKSLNQDGVSSNQVFPRFTYDHTGEYENNPEGVNDAVENLLGGPDANNTLLWWDVKQDFLGQPGDNF